MPVDLVAAARTPCPGIGRHHVVAAAAFLPGLVGLPDHDLAGGREQGSGLPHGHPAGVTEDARPGAREGFVALDCQTHEEADAGGALQGTPSGDCVARAIKGATFKKFKGSPMTIDWPVMLR